MGVALSLFSVEISDSTHRGTSEILKIWGKKIVSILRFSGKVVSHLRKDLISNSIFKCAF